MFLFQGVVCHLNLECIWNTSQGDFVVHFNVSALAKATSNSCMTQWCFELNVVVFSGWFGYSNIESEVIAEYVAVTFPVGVCCCGNEIKETLGG